MNPPPSIDEESVGEGCRQIVDSRQTAFFRTPLKTVKSSLADRVTKLLNKIGLYSYLLFALSSGCTYEIHSIVFNGKLLTVPVIIPSTV